MSYWVVVVTRNGAAHLPRTLDSLLSQREAPNRITVVDDGSSDETPNILRKYLRLSESINVLTRPDHGYDIRRVPANINQAWKVNADSTSDYFMISGDDCTYPIEYAASLLTRMNLEKKLVVASGQPTVGGRSQERSPSGSGRMVRCTFWRQVGGAYPLRAGWETWLLYKATFQGLEVQLFEDLRYAHARPRGAGHQFVYWGAAMGTLGYHPLYAVGRIAKNALAQGVGARGSLNMLRGYLQSKFGSDDPFMSPFDKSLQTFVRRQQELRIQMIVVAILQKSRSREV